MMLPFPFDPAPFTNRPVDLVGAVYSPLTIAGLWGKRGRTKERYICTALNADGQRINVLVFEEHTALLIRNGYSMRSVSEENPVTVMLKSTGSHLRIDAVLAPTGQFITLDEFRAVAKRQLYGVEE